MATLGEYAIDAVHGFVPADDPVDTLPAYFAPWERLGRNLAALIMTGRMRPAVESMPVLEPDRLRSSGEQERAMLLLCCLANAYVWATDTPADMLPASVAQPLHTLAECLDRAPIISHASIVLHNWRRIDADEPLSVSNIDTQVTFLGGVDEKWFYLATVGVELAGAPGLSLLVRAQHAAAAEDQAALTEALFGIRAVVDKVTGAFLGVERWCDHYVFYHRVRPFLTGWSAPGLRFAGVDGEPLVLAGGSAAQSSLIQAFDAGLDIPHPHGTTAGFLTGMRAYMPGPHRRFLTDLEAGPSVRECVERNRVTHPLLGDAYNEAVDALVRLRAQHIGITGRYIKRFERDQETAQGTGGSDFVAFLKKSREETTERLLPRRRGCTGSSTKSSWTPSSPSSMVGNGWWGGSVVSPVRP
ncbi:indoleamine 2,3-dioxygenase [Micromonospora sp. KC207]|uniref:indoleamine 2,3-dioxygenase n=1 Tax=Micromonospora sp. KC207 TaxID=2530377 RepID=UPI0014055C2C|nr:indoleamine 2,3-dioxygenase [Micromonospora sp. KC207]